MPKKQTKKSKKADVNFELRRLGVLVEHSNDKWDLIAEQYGGIKEDVGEIKEEIGGIKEEISGIKVELGGLTETVGKLAIDMAIVKEDIEFIKGGLKKKVDVEEFSALERRVLLLEKKVK